MQFILGLKRLDFDGVDSCTINLTGNAVMNLDNKRNFTLTTERLSLVVNDGICNMMLDGKRVIYQESRTNCCAHHSLLKMWDLINQPTGDDFQSYVNNLVCNTQFIFHANTFLLVIRN